MRRSRDNGWGYTMSTITVCQKIGALVKTRRKECAHFIWARLSGRVVLTFYTTKNAMTGTSEAGFIVSEHSRPIVRNGRYQNPWDDWGSPKILSCRLLRFILTTKIPRIPRRSVLDETLPVLRPNVSYFSTSPPPPVIRYLWIGHATSLVQFDGVTFLTDPMFSKRCSPVPLVGPKRYRPPACSVTGLPHVDFVLISHNHYDHLDCQSVRALNARFGSHLRWYVPMGLKIFMNQCGCINVVELTWWQECVHNEETKVKVVCTPSYHWCKRTLFDNNKVLWSSWCVIGPKYNFFFAGDTGSCPGFKEIGNEYGPFTLATIPIGAYQPRWLLSHQHVNPEEAVDIHKDVRAQISIAIHWGTFPLGYEPYFEPREKLKEALVKKGVSSSSFITIRHGEIITVTEQVTVATSFVNNFIVFQQ